MEIFSVPTPSSTYKLLLLTEKSLSFVPTSARRTKLMNFSIDNIYCLGLGRILFRKYLNHDINHIRKYCKRLQIQMFVISNAETIFNNDFI